MRQVFDQELRPARGWLVIGAPMEGSGTNRGEVDAPGTLRHVGLVDGLGAVDFGDLPVLITDNCRDPHAGVIGYQQLVNGSGLIADSVSSALHAGWTPFVVGGCCSILPGALAGARRHTGPTRLVFVDGHLDLFTPRTSRTGELAGMALAVATGYGSDGLAGVAEPAPLVAPRDVLAIGDADQARRRSFGGAEAATAIPDARVFDAPSIHALGAPVVGQRMAALIDRDDLPLWLHLDVDVLDGSVMPAVSYPVTGGIDWADLEILLRFIVKDSRLLGVSLAGLNVDRDSGLVSARRLVALWSTLLA